MNVYRVTYDLVKELPTTEGRKKLVVVDAEPVAKKMIVAKDFYAAVAKARDIQNDLRPSAVHKELAVRDVRLIYSEVIVDA